MFIVLVLSAVPVMVFLPFLPFPMFSVFSYNLGSCANNRNKCSKFGECRDYANGYCCHCISGFYGNGIQCVAEGTRRKAFKYDVFY